MNSGFIAAKPKQRPAVAQEVQATLDAINENNGVGVGALKPLVLTGLADQLDNAPPLNPAPELNGPAVDELAVLEQVAKMLSVLTVSRRRKILRILGDLVG